MKLDIYCTLIGFSVVIFKPVDVAWPPMDNGRGRQFIVLTLPPRNVNTIVLVLINQPPVLT